MHRAIVPFLLLAVLLSLLWACGEEPPSSGESGPSAAETQETATTEPAADAPEPNATAEVNATLAGPETAPSLHELLALPGEPQSGTMLRLGVLGPFDRDQEHGGQHVEAALDMARGVRAAVRAFLQDGNLPGFDGVRLYPENSACEYRQAAAGANALLAEDVVAVIGAYCSPATLAAAQTLDQAGVPLLIPAATDVRLTNMGMPYVFRLTGTDEEQAALAADVLTGRLAAGSVFFVHDNTDYALALVEALTGRLERTGVDVAGTEAVYHQTLDHAATLEKVRAAGPDVLYLAVQDPAGAARLVSQARNMGLECAVVTMDAAYHPRFIALAGAEGEGVYVTAQQMAEDSQAYARAAQAFRELDFGAPGPLALRGYDAASVLLRAVSRAGSTQPDLLKEAILTMDFPGATGRMAFRPNGDLTHIPYEVLVVRNGRFQQP